MGASGTSRTSSAPRLVRRRLGSLVGLAVALAALPAAAEGPLALARFEPAPAGDRMLGVPSPSVDGELAARAALCVDYAHNPLVLRYPGQTDAVAAIVSSQLLLHVSGSLSLLGRVGLNIDWPITLVQSGEAPSAENRAVFASSRGLQGGDLRLGIRFPLFSAQNNAIELAVGGYAWVPAGSGDAGSFVSDGRPRGQPQIIGGGQVNRVVWSAALGPELRAPRKFDGAPLGASFTGGAGVGYIADEARRLQIGGEAVVSAPFTDPGRRNTNAEILASARYQFDEGVVTGVGVGPGISHGIGTPDVRVVAMLALAPEVRRASDPPPDRDNDGIVDAADACPSEPGQASPDRAKNGCKPPKDRDGDGVVDAADACPDAAGVASADAAKAGCPPPPDRDNDGIVDDADACPDVAGAPVTEPGGDAKKNGCPPDKDGDGVADADDACPEIAGLKGPDAAANGCPGDSDADAVRDDKDACPRDRGKPDPDASKDGCPSGVRVDGADIVLLRQIEFENGKSAILPSSEPLLDEIAAVIKGRPEIVKVEVQGHTDNTGDAQFNLTISQGRAEAVVEALVKRGVAAPRLSAKGYGQRAPIADNGTIAGRQQNRRVRLAILKEAQAPP